MDLDKVNAYFLAGDYKSAIAEGEKILAGHAYSGEMDELYYVLGLSYMKDGNYLRASDIFEIILNEFRNSRFKEPAMMGLGDTYFLRGDLARAKNCYQDMLNNNSRTKLKARLYGRLSRVALKQGDTKQAKEYLDKLKTEFPLCAEVDASCDLIDTIATSAGAIFYTVQVGSFTNNTNAGNLVKKLSQKGYPAYMEEASDATGSKIYRVRVGKLDSRAEAAQFAGRLSQEGYPTKIFP
jgi:tetratricopeptide (TPR) repeat protein